MRGLEQANGGRYTTNFIFAAPQYPHQTHIVLQALTHMLTLTANGQSGGPHDYSYHKLEKLDLSLINFILPADFDERDGQVMVSEVRQTILVISF